MSRRNTITSRYDLKSIADKYWTEQVNRLGPIEYAPMPVFIPVPVTPKRNRRKRAHA